MPIEVLLLERKPTDIRTCPKCKAPFLPFLRGQVQKTLPSPCDVWRMVIHHEHWKYCALICAECKEIVGYESPYDDNYTSLL